ncbi:MAG: branched-chain amino acid ABC transporter permease [Oscillospiraceae bacterium]|jgi:branched-chain amino acid transport system permease protein|nr:branched-chain amino acid ABC transporter permease [Oscillospiraceae bacterium]
MSTFLQILLRSLETGGVYALAALAIIIVLRTSMVAHFAQGTMAMFSTYVVALLCSKRGFPLWQSLLIGVAVAVAMAFAVDFFIIRRAKRASAVSKEIITLGLIMVFLGLAPVVFGVDPQLMPKAIPHGGDFQFLGASISHNAFLNICIGLFFMGLLFFILQKTKLGLAVRVTASNEPIARLMGVSTRNITLLAWITAGILGLLSGVMIAPATTVTTTLMNPVQLNALFACVLGGFQTFYGPVLGAYIIGIGRNLLTYYVSSEWGEQLLYVLLLIFLLLRPNGLIGRKFIKKV